MFSLRFAEKMHSKLKFLTWKVYLHNLALVKKDPKYRLFLSKFSLQNCNIEYNYLLLVIYKIELPKNPSGISLWLYANFLQSCCKFFAIMLQVFFSIVRVIIDAQFAHHEFTVNSIRLLFLPLHLHFKKCCEKVF